MADKYEQYSQEELIRLLRERDRKPKFGLVWERDEIDHDNSLNDDFVVLDVAPELSAGAGPWRNLIIEGDNFDALRYLRMTHAGKVRCIYIDPPYNTGNKDFIYNDRFVDKEDVYKHSKWLEYLYRRLLLARELLSEDGVMLVSINDENRAKLELLLDQVFPGMRLGSFVWRTKDTGNDAGGMFSQVHEHVLVFANPAFAFQGKPISLDKYKNLDDDPDGPYALDPLTKAHSYTERPNTYYPIQDPLTGYWYPCDPDRVWAYATKARLKENTKLRAETIEELIDKKHVWFPQCKPKEVMQWSTKAELIQAIRDGKGPVLPKKKTPLLREDLPDLDFWVGKPIAPGRPSRKSHLKFKDKMIAPVSSWIAGLNEEVDFLYDELSEEVESLRSPRGGEGTDAINEILGTKAFSHPKPPTLIRNLLRQATKPDDLVLDFFAGSGTTAQAVLELNKEDGGSRRFIMVSSTEATAQEPKKNICRDVCAKRINGVINGYRKTPGTGGDFAYLRASRIAAERVLAGVRHEQVWLALQLIHFSSIEAFDPKQNLQVAHGVAMTVAYLPRLDEKATDEIIKIAEKLPKLVVYSWQPGQLRERIHLPNVNFEKIPEYLVARFGGER